MERWQYGPDTTLGQQRQPGERYSQHFRRDQLAPRPKRRRAETYPQFADQRSQVSSKVSCVLCRVVLTSSEEISEHLSSKEHYEVMRHHPGIKVEDALIPESFEALDDKISDLRHDYPMGNRPQSRTAQGQGVIGLQTYPQKSQLSNTSFQISESELQLARQLNFADAKMPHPGVPSSGKIQSLEVHVGASYPKQHRRIREPFQLQDAGQRTREPFQLQDAGQRTREPFQLQDAVQRTQEPFQLQDAGQRTREPFQLQDAGQRTRKPFQLQDAGQRTREPFQLQDAVQRTQEPFQLQDAGQKTREPFQSQDAGQRTREPFQLQDAGQRTREPFQLQDAGQRTREPFQLQDAVQRTREPFQLQDAGQGTQGPFQLQDMDERIQEPFQLQDAGQRTREPFQLQDAGQGTQRPFQLQDAGQRTREPFQLQRVGQRIKEPIQVHAAGQRTRHSFKLQEAAKKKIPQVRTSSPHTSESRKLHTRKKSDNRGGLKQAAKIKVEPKKEERPEVKVEAVAMETDMKESLIRCKACNIVVPNQFHWEAHIKSERHLENLRKAEEAKAQKQEEEGQVVTEEEMEILERMRAEEEQEEAEEMAGWDVPETELSEERGGEKAVELQPESALLSPSQVSEDSRPPNFPSIQQFPEDPNMEIHIELHCGLCKVMVQNRDYWEAHTQSPIHQKALASTSAASKVVGVTGPPLAMFYCNICNTFSYSEKHFAEHVTGRRHRENRKRKPQDLSVPVPKVAKNQNPDKSQNAPQISQQHVTSSGLRSNVQPTASSQALSQLQVQGSAREGRISKSAKPVQKQVLRKAVELNSSATNLSFSLKRLQKQLSDTPTATLLSSSQSDPVNVSQPATSTTEMAERSLQETREKESSKARGKRCITPILPPDPSATEDPPPKKRVIKLKRPRSRDSSAGVSRGSSDVEYQGSEENWNDKKIVPSGSAPPQSTALTSSTDYLRPQQSPPLKALPDSSGTSRMETHAAQHRQASKEISPASTSASTSSRPAITRRVIRLKRSSTTAQSHPQYESVPSKRRVRRSVTPQYPQSTHDHFEEDEHQRIEDGYGNEPETNEEESYLEFEIHPDTPDFEQYYGQDFTLPFFKRTGNERSRGTASTQPQNQGGGGEYCDGGNKRSGYDYFNTNFRYDVNFDHEHPERAGFRTETPKMHQFGRSFQQPPQGTQTRQRGNWHESQYLSDSFRTPSQEWASHVPFHPMSEHHTRFGTPKQPEPQPRVGSSEAVHSFDSRPTSSNSSTTGRDQFSGSQNPSLMYPSGNRILADDSGRPRAIQTINYNHGFENRHSYSCDYQPLF